MVENKKINWRVILILFLLSIIGIISVIPYLLNLQTEMIEQLPIPIEIIIASSIIQSSIIFFLLILLGYVISKKIGLGTPIIEKFSEGKKIKDDIKQILPISIGLGALVSLLLIGLDFLFYTSGVIIETTMISPTALQGLLASFYGGINEEIMLRFFLMSLFVFIFFKISKNKEKTSKNMFWLAIIITAVIFGLAHLPLTADLVELTPLIILRALILNGVAGIVFGHLYWKKGLESAMISHFSADIILHSVVPALNIFGGL